MKPRFALLSLLFALTAWGGDATLHSPLVIGPHAVGFDEWREDALTVSVWYPSTVTGTAMRFADYVGDQRADFAAFLSGAGLSAGAVDAYLAAPMLAARKAPVAGGRSPIIAIAQGNRQTAADHAVLAEYLASYGYVVVTTPSPMIATPMKSADEIGQFAELQAKELLRAIGAVERRLRVDSSRIGVVGHSFGARAALLLAMREPRVRAIVSLDGGIGTASGVESLKAAPSFQSRDVPAILHLYETEDAFMNRDFELLRSIHPASLHTENLIGFHHAHFTTTGFAAALLPELARLTRAPENISSGLADLAESTRRFLDRHVRAPARGSHRSP